MSEEQEPGDSGEEQEVINTEAKAEDQAALSGWTPKDEWKGDPEQWKDAETFNRDGERIHSHMRGKITSLENRIGEQAKTLKDFGEHHKKTLETQKKTHEREVKALKVQQRKAALDEDMDKFDELAEQQEELEKNAPEASPEPSNAVPSEVITWEEKNPWFASDGAMQAYAIERKNQISEQYPGMTLAEALEETTKDVRERFPEKFGAKKNARRTEPNKVEGGATSHKKGGKTYNDLPQEAKTACDGFIREGLFENKEEYLKDYDWS